MKRTAKLLSLALALLLAVSALAGCTSQTQEAAAMNVAALNGPTGIGMVKLMKDSETTEYPAFDPTFTLAASPRTSWPAPCFRVMPTLPPCPPTWPPPSTSAARAASNCWP